MARLIRQPDSSPVDLSWISSIWQKPLHRLFWITQVPQGAIRGGHHHVRAQMMLHCPVGSLKVYVQTPQQDEWYSLDSPDQCLLLGPEDWRVMYDFSEEAILVVLSDTPFTQMKYFDRPYRSMALTSAMLPTQPPT